MQTYSQVLITTPDHPSKSIGGLSTFCVNLEEILCELEIRYELFIWNNINEVKFKDYSNYELILNVHYLPSLYIEDREFINFIHGGELCLYSPVFIKRIVKKLMKNKIRSSLHRSKYNLFISEFSFDFYKNLYGGESYERDLIFHNCIQTNDEPLIKKSFEGKLKLCCFVRNVPHKNIEGTIRFVEKLNELHPQGCILYLSSDSVKHNLVQNIVSISDEEREEVYKDSHLNLLFSLDHSSKGQFEGFGLTVLESGKYGVPTVGMKAAGLQDSIHHKKTGWLFDSNEFDEIETFYSWISQEYNELQNRTYNHTHTNHSLCRWKEFLGALL